MGRGLWGMVVLVGVVGVGGCRDNGLPDRNLSIEEARHREQAYAPYEAAPAERPVAAAGRNWMPSLPLEQIPDAILTPVGNGGETPLFALQSDEAPYDRLYARVRPGEWRPFLRLQ